MKKVLIAFDDLGLGGIQTKIISLLNGLAKNEKVKVFLILKKRAKFDRSDELDKRIRVFYTPQLFPSFFKSRYYYFIFLISLLWKPYSIFLSMDKTAVFFMKLLEKYKCSISSKIVINIDNYLKFSQEERSEDITKYLNKANAIVAVSDEVFEDLSRRLKVSTKKIKKIYNWTLLSNQNEKLKKYSERENDFVYAGRLSKQKQPWLFPVFVKFFSFFNKDICSLSIYGFGSFKKQVSVMSRVCEVEKFIFFKKTTKEIKKVLSNSKFLLLTSKYEGMPFIALEAMALGCVVVSLEAPGIQTLIDDGKNGVMKNSLISLAESVSKIKHQKYFKIQQNALKAVKTKYGFKNREKIINILIG